ncbi:uncharacterized protein LOC142975656 [Anticarsia gemmatalis]|uniref:uncharacterized protein LOC142975656 n=1 Tax=Anticarsia gemmatalis TaxID=129554 RepID=UPI003F76CAFD
MNNLNVDEAIGYVQNIIDDVRCPTCDKLEGARLRYSCGHTVCEDCVTYTVGCQICTSPSLQSDHQPKHDYPQTQVVKKATKLLEACRNLFDPNAFQRKRISEQLRIEKELFPKCIQAPAKYENKRKSVTVKDTTYTSFLPGEAISQGKENKMENTVNYVQQWLSQNKDNLARKPFADLNVNSQYVKSPRQRQTPQKNVKNKSDSLGLNRKRTHFKTTCKDLPQLDEDKKLVPTPKRVKKKSSASSKEITSGLQNKLENDESGIFMDNDPIVIDDSQETFIDKDKQAWLAVLEACKNERFESTSIVSTSQVNTADDINKQLISSNALNIKDNHNTKVPFFKKSAILETCKYCKDEMNENYSSAESVTDKSSPVKITIDSESFLTTITVVKNVQSNVNTKSCVAIQTDTCTSPTPLYAKDDGLIKLNENNCNVLNKSMPRHVSLEKSVDASDTFSEDLFADDRKIFGDEYQKTEVKCLVIEESDSDTHLDDSGPMSVKADVHRSCEEKDYGILTEVLNMNDHENRPRHGPRGHTPTSTDSSDKENYHPNRIKKRKTEKKKSTKK